MINSKNIISEIRIISSRILRGFPVKNIFANLAGVAWGGIAILVVTPFYISTLGLNGYSLIGLWLMLQGLIGLADLGVGPALAQGLARGDADENNPDFKNNLLRTLEIVNLSLAAVFFIIVTIIDRTIIKNWINQELREIVGIEKIFRLMSISLCLQFIALFYMNGLTGLQRHGLTNVVQAIWSSLRWYGGALVLFGNVAYHIFFGFQIFISLFQLLIVRQIVWRLVGAGARSKPCFSISILVRNRRFCIGMGLHAVLAACMANVDRVLLSQFAAPEEFAKYSIAFTLSGLLQMVIQPFYRVFYPRYTHLVSSGDIAILENEYLESCKIMAGVLIPLGGIGIAFAPEILNIWLQVSDGTVVVTMRLLLFAISLSGLLWLPAAFQHAHAWTGLHLKMVVLSLISGIPIMFYTIPQYGAPGATVVWLCHGIIGISLEIWLMHQRISISRMWLWYKEGVLTPVLKTMPIIFLARVLFPSKIDRIVSLFTICFLILICICNSLIGFVRYHLRRQVN